MFDDDCGQVIPVCGINRPVHLRLLLVLLLRTVRYVRFHANLFLLRLHGLHLLRFLSHAWGCWFPCIAFLCPSHIPLDQVRVVSLFWSFCMFNNLPVLQIWVTMRNQGAPCNRIVGLSRIKLVLLFYNVDLRREYVVPLFSFYS